MDINPASLESIGFVLTGDAYIFGVPNGPDVIVRFSRDKFKRPFVISCMPGEIREAGEGEQVPSDLCEVAYPGIERKWQIIELMEMLGFKPKGEGGRWLVN